MCIRYLLCVLIFCISSPIFAQYPAQVELPPYQSDVKATQKITIKNGFAVPPGGTFTGEIVLPSYTATVSYGTMKEQLDDSYYIAKQSKTYIQYGHKGGNMVVCTLYNPQHISIGSQQMNVKEGVNYMTMDWTGVSVQTTSYYILEIKDENDFKQYIRVKFAAL